MKTTRSDYKNKGHRVPGFRQPLNSHREPSEHILPGAMENLIRQGLFELGDDGKPIITAKGRAQLRRLERS